MINLRKSIKPISLILIVHQEAQTIEGVIKDFYEKIISKIPSSQFIVCEDGSSDGTKEILKRIKKGYHLTLNMALKKRGYTKALRDGLKMAKEKVIFFSDSDGQHEPDDFWKLYPKLKQSDMVIGWKKNRQDGWHRLLLAFIFNKLIAVYFKINLHDIDCGFRLIKKEVVDFILKKPWRLDHCVSSELAVRAKFAGFKVSEVPITHYSRKSGPSRGLPFSKLPKIIFHILKEFPNIKEDVGRYSLSRSIS